MKALSPSTSSPLFCWVSLTTKLLLCLCWLSGAYYYYKSQSSQSTGPPKYRKWTPLWLEIFLSDKSFSSCGDAPDWLSSHQNTYPLSQPFLLPCMFSAPSWASSSLLETACSQSLPSLLQPAASSLYHPHPNPCPGLHDTAILTGVEFLFATLSLLPFSFFLTRTFLLVEFLVLPFSLLLFGPRDCMKQKAWP